MRHWLILAAIALAMAGCASQPVPSADDFTEAAVGTLMLGGHEEGIKPDLPPDQSGALFINQTGYRLQVAVNNTIADIPIGYDFLFTLPPGQYQFYIFEPDRPPRVHTETLVGGKLRYLYVTRIGRSAK